MVAAVLVGACASPTVAAPPAAGPPPGGGPPAPAIVPANASRVTARVVAHAAYAPGALSAPPPVSMTKPYYSLTLDVISTAPADANKLSLAKPGALEAFSLTPVPTDLDGRNVDAVVRLEGNTQGSRWFIVHLETQ
jgi:hypothetical protein